MLHIGTLSGYVCWCVVFADHNIEHYPFISISANKCASFVFVCSGKGSRTGKYIGCILRNISFAFSAHHYYRLLGWILKRGIYFHLCLCVLYPVQSISDHLSYHQSSIHHYDLIVAGFVMWSSPSKIVYAAFVITGCSLKEEYGTGERRKLNKGNLIKAEEQRSFSLFRVVYHVVLMLFLYSSIIVYYSSFSFHSLPLLLVVLKS